MHLLSIQALLHLHYLYHARTKCPFLCLMCFFSVSFLPLLRCPCYVLLFSAVPANALVPSLSLIFLFHLCLLCSLFSLHISLSPSLSSLALLLLFSPFISLSFSDPSLPLSEAVCDYNAAGENTVCQPESDR